MKCQLLSRLLSINHYGHIMDILWTCLFFTTLSLVTICRLPPASARYGSASLAAPRPSFEQSPRPPLFWVFNGILWYFNGDFMGFYGILMGFNGI